MPLGTQDFAAQFTPLRAHIAVQGPLLREQASGDHPLLEPSRASREVQFTPFNPPRQPKPKCCKCHKTIQTLSKNYTIQPTHQHAYHYNGYYPHSHNYQQARIQNTHAHRYDSPRLYQMQRPLTPSRYREISSGGQEIQEHEGRPSTISQATTVPYRAARRKDKRCESPRTDHY